MTKKEVRTKRIAEGFRGGKVPPIKPDISHWESDWACSKRVILEADKEVSK